LFSFRWCKLPIITNSRASSKFNHLTTTSHSSRCENKCTLTPVISDIDADEHGDYIQCDEDDIADAEPQNLPAVALIHAQEQLVGEVEHDREEVNIVEEDLQDEQDTHLEER
jgi:hypothetical protein